MKKLLFAILTVLTTTTISAPPIPAQPLRTITVAGTAQTTATPDIITWTISVNTNDPDLKLAKSENDTRFTAALTAAQQAADTPQDVTAGPVRIDRSYTRNQAAGTRTFSHYSVRRTIKLTQHDFAEFEETLNALINSAEIELRFAYEISNKESIKNDLRLQALDAARAKAKAMVERLDGELGEVVEISEFPLSDRSSVKSLDLPAPPSYDQVSPEARRIFVPVYVTFEIE